MTSVWTATYTVQGFPGTATVDGDRAANHESLAPAADYGSVLTGN